MIKYYHVPKQHKTIAVLSGCADDAVNKIGKILGGTKSIWFDPERYRMKDVYRAVVVCHADDIYSPEDGERQAKSKLLDYYYSVLDKKLEMFAEDLNTAMFEVTNRMSCSKHRSRAK